VFGRKKKEIPCQEIPDQSRDLEELDTLWSELEAEKQSLKELQDTYRQKLEELDGETERRRKALDEEILLRKRLTEEHIQKNLTAFRENYSYYLSQIKLLMDVLTTVSLAVSETIVSQEDMDTEALFRDMFSARIDSETILRAGQDQAPESPEESAGMERLIPNREVPP